MASHIDADEWRRLSPHLDHVLDLEPRDRAEWLRRLETSESGLAEALRELLAEKNALEGRHFLEDSPAAFAEGGTLVGQRIGVYEIERLIERGGMGTVWLGRRCDGRYEGTAAIKLLNAALVGRPAEQRFIREGSVLGGLQHPNIAHLIDAGVSTAGQPYLVLEHVEGSSIDEYCDAHGLGVHARLQVFLDVLEAVACAHRHLVVHRDLKPSNILVTSDGFVKLLDFGIATLLDPGTGVQAGSAFTREIGAALTPEYAAPEQLLGGTVTTATDIYALGRVLYVLLGGPQAAMPRDRSAVDLMRDTLEREPPLLSELAGDQGARRLLRGDLDNIVRKASKKEPRERYASVEAFAEDIRRHLSDEPVSARPDSFGYRAGKFVRRNRGRVLGGAVAALALVVTTGFAVAQMLEAQRQRDEALEQTRRAEAFNQVVTSLLSQVGPDGHALGAEELLDRAVEEVTARYAGEPALLVDLLQQISARYYELRDTRKEYATLVTAEAIARDSGDAALTGNVLCNLTETELVAGRVHEAQARMTEARRLLRGARVPVPPLVQVTCLRSEAELAAAQEDLQAVFVHLEKAQHLLEAEHLTEGYAYPAILTKLAKYHSRSGHLVAAYEYARVVADLDRRAGRQDSMPGLIARMSVAVSLYHLGQVQPALAMFREAVPDRTATEPGNPPSMSARAKYGEMLARAGRIDAAMPLLLEAVADADRSGHYVNEIRTRLSLARALVYAGRAADAQPALEKAAALMQHDDAENSFWLADMSRLRIEMLLAQHRVEEAADELARVLEWYRRAPGNEPRMAEMLLTQARVRLARAEYGQAAESARSAAALFQKNTIDPEKSADVGEALLVLARAERAAGQLAASRRSFERARVALRNSLGDEHELALQAERLSAQVL